MDKSQPCHSSSGPSDPTPTVNTSTTADPSTLTAQRSQPSSTSAFQPTECQSQSQSQNQSQSQSQHQPPAAQPADPAYPHQIHGLGGPTATAPFLRDFSLVAEAASRAQVSVVTRDLEGVSL
ncbi:hypothetical protein PHISP_03809 [Aspergillus sp. HF37]|nr:hypothetical protein PHISP_03809 [Aspergillus sp. HF37]